jgi:hypothetical protein
MVKGCGRELGKVKSDKAVGPKAGLLNRALGSSVRRRRCTSTSSHLLSFNDLSFRFGSISPYI